MQRRFGARSVAIWGIGSAVLIGALLVPATALAAPPSNDKFADATVISALPYADLRTITDAAPGDNQQDTNCDFPTPATQSIWYRYKAPANEVLRFDTIGSNVATMLDVFTIGTNSSVTWIDCDWETTEGAQQISSLAWNAQKGVRYAIRAAVATATPETPVAGHISVHLRVVTPTLHDRPLSAGAITSLPFSAALNTRNATDEPDYGEPRPSCDIIGATVWYRYKAAATGVLRADTLGSDFNTVLSVYRRTSTSIAPVACSDDVTGGTNGFQSRVAFPVTKGVVYYIQLGGMAGGSGNLAFSIRKVVAPVNDAFASATPITTGTFNIDTQNATVSSIEREPTCGTEPGGTRWYTFTVAADTSRQLSIASGPTFAYPFAALWKGTAPGNLTEVTCVNGAGSPTALGPGTYYVQVGGVLGDNGTTQFSLLDTSH